MKPKISVIVPCSRGVKELSQIIRDFRNQTLEKNKMELIMVYDGKPPQDVEDMLSYIDDEWIHFFQIKKDPGDMKIAPGTQPRNAGLQRASGQYVTFCDDDDRYRDDYLATLVDGADGNIINIAQMSCQESRMFRNGDPTKWRLVPEIGLPYFPMICHVGTPCFCIPRSWALECPWQSEPEHDYRFIKRICEKFHPQIRLIPGFRVDVDGLIVKDIKDWVNRGPMFRD